MQQVDEMVKYIEHAYILQVKSLKKKENNCSLIKLHLTKIRPLESYRQKSA